MVRLVLLIAILGIALLLWYKIKIAKPAERKKVIFWSILSALGLVLLLLAMTGHLNIITAAIAALFAAAPRLLQYARYLPFIQKMFQQHTQTGQNQQQNTAESARKGMSKQQAYDILGLKPGCNREDIISAHKRMMQKVHPDRGGSDYLAAQINQAKDVLLG